MLLSIAVFAAFFTSCNIDNNSTTTPTNAAFLVAHASPDAPNIDVFVNDQNLLSNFPYGANTTYVGINPGTSNFKITETGTQNILAETNVNLLPSTGYSIFTIDSLNDISFSIVIDSFLAPSSDSIKLRFLNLSPNSPSIDLAIKDSTVLYTNRTFNDQNFVPTFARFVGLKAGIYNFEIRETGTSNLIYSFSNTLEGGRAYTIYAKGFAGGTGTQAFNTGLITNL